MTRLRSRMAPVAIVIGAVLIVAGCCTDSEAADEQVAELEQEIVRLQAQAARIQTEQESTSSSVPSKTAPVSSTSVPPMSTDHPQAPTIELEWWWTNDDPSFMWLSAVAWVTNPNDVSLSGVVVHWEARDEDGILVGGWARRLPTIDANSAFPYIISAGNIIADVPETVEVFVDARGQIAPAGTPSAMLEVLGTVPDPDMWEPRATVRAPHDRSIDPSRVTPVWIARDETGSVIGAHIGNRAHRPETLSAGDVFDVKTLLFFVDSDLPPAEVEVYVYEDLTVEEIGGHGPKGR